MALLDDIKLALRIKHNLLDTEIQSEITSARQEMIRAGVDSAVANGLTTGTVELVEEAIKAYVLGNHERDVRMAERFEISFRYQLDNLRKSYPAEVSTNV